MDPPAAAFVALPSAESDTRWMIINEPGSAALEKSSEVKAILVNSNDWISGGSKQEYEILVSCLPAGREAEDQ